jgi:hypothetical protein
VCGIVSVAGAPAGTMLAAPGQGGASVGQVDPSRFCGETQVAPDGPMQVTALAGTTVEQLAQRAAQKEMQFRLARQAYAYSAEMVVQTLKGDRVDGELRATGVFGFAPDGTRTGAMTTSMNTIKRVRVPVADVDPYEFVFVPETKDLHRVTYVGRQEVEGTPAWVIDVAPLPGAKCDTCYEGRLWVSEADYAIVRLDGRAVFGSDGRKDVRGTERRQLVDGKFRFPACFVADDTLTMRSGPVRIRQLVRYANYRRPGI